ncbi:unnamed protein product, partial [Mesorhabditis belari]|uniref:G-protein coupled receptors family 1 profile domain-containing protein n=1 Tax=Mesorhabditis belari TaxID=2138241 RepID=A0AAF3J6X1_9BILA
MECGDPPLFNPHDNLTNAVLDSLFVFDRGYKQIHRYLAVFLCVFGLLFNSVHIWVLRQPRLRSTSVHTVLVGIACSDIGTMVSYLIYITRYEFFKQNDGYAYVWSIFLQLHALISIACHAITLYLVVLMAFIRWRVMINPGSGWMRTQRACFGSILIAFWVVVLCIPTFLAHQIKSYEPMDEEQEILYNVGFSDMMLTNGCFLMKANLWLTGIFLKAIPCFLLFWLTAGLLHQMKVNREKRKLILHVKEDEKQRRRGDQTTYMLLLMVSVFLFTELPQGFIAIFYALYTKEFYLNVYMPIADLLDLLSLVNCYVAFLVYVCTCSRYRQTLLTILPNVERIVSTITTRQNTIVGGSGVKRESAPNWAKVIPQNPRRYSRSQEIRTEATQLMNGNENYDTYL